MGELSLWLQRRQLNARRLFKCPGSLRVGNFAIDLRRFPARRFALRWEIGGWVLSALAFQKQGCAAVGPWFQGPRCKGRFPFR